MTSWNATTEITRWNSQMANVPQALKDAAKDANTKSQEEFAKRLYRAAPLGPSPSHIRNTIQKRDGDQTKFEKIVSIGSAALYYIIPLEFGHKTKGGKFIPGTRFFRSVRTIMRKKHRNRTRTAVRKALKKLFP
jgi:hypothetical protein